MKMRDQCLTILLISVFGLSACNETNKTGDKTTSGVHFAKDTLKAEISDKQLSKYELYGDLYTFNDESYFAGYNRQYHNVDFFNLTQGNYMRSLELAEIGPDKVAKGKFKVLGDTAMLFHQDDAGKLLLVRLWDAEISKTFNYRDNLEHAGYYFRPRQVNKSNHLPYNSSRQSILMYVKPYGKDTTTKKQFANTFKDLYEGNFIAEYFPFKDSLHIVNESYPAFLSHKNAFYGNLSVPFFINKDTRIIYNFPAFSYVCVFNRSTNKTQIYSAESTVISNKAGTLSWGDRNNLVKVMKHSTNEAQFLQIYWDAYNKLYYRVFQKALKNGEISHFGLTVMDKSFTVLSENMVPEIFYKIYTGKKGIYYFPKQTSRNFTMISLKPVLE